VWGSLKGHCSAFTPAANGSRRSQKTAAVLRLLRGEDLETVSRRLGVTAATLSGGRDAFLAAGEAALATKPPVLCPRLLRWARCRRQGRHGFGAGWGRPWHPIRLGLHRTQSRAISCAHVLTAAKRSPGRPVLSQSPLTSNITMVRNPLPPNNVLMSSFKGTNAFSIPAFAVVRTVDEVVHSKETGPIGRRLTGSDARVRYRFRFPPGAGPCLATDINT
jgi:hypothetical protein